jgi:hypothetical protein
MLHLTLLTEGEGLFFPLLGKGRGILIPKLGGRGGGTAPCPNFIGTFLLRLKLYKERRVGKRCKGAWKLDERKLHICM